jgi:hypothetical protein
VVPAEIRSSRADLLIERFAISPEAAQAVHEHCVSTVPLDAGAIPDPLGVWDADRQQRVLNPWVVDFMRGGDGLSVAVTALSLPVPRIGGEVADRIYGILTNRSIAIEIVAPGMSLAPAYAAAALHTFGLDPLLLQLDPLADAEIETLILDLFLQARLLGVAPILLLPASYRPSVAFWSMLGSQRWPVVVVVEARSRVFTPLPPFATFELTRDQRFAQARAWRELLPPECDQLDLGVLGRIRLGLPAMREAFERAASEAAAYERPIAEDDLVRYATAVRLDRGSRMARLRVPSNELADLVVADSVRDGIQDFAVAARKLLLRDPADRIGLRALLTGPSGTGKTATAEALGSRLGVPVLFVDVGQVVDKYIGETEKHLDQVLNDAENADALLVFDEGEALFSARSHGSDGVGAEASNRQTAYLLARLEQHRGLVIVASNYAGSIDKAFVRRFHFTVTFATPTEAERRAIWASKLAKYRLGTADAVDRWSAVELSGGNIENICMLASLLRTDEIGVSETITRLVRQEASRLGKRVS